MWTSSGRSCSRPAASFVCSAHSQVSDRHGSFSSVLRTIELLLGLRPMTHFDARRPLADVIANATPAHAPAYSAVQPTFPFLEGGSG